MWSFREWKIREISFTKGVLQLSYFPVDGDPGREMLEKRLIEIGFKFEIGIAKTASFKGVLQAV